MHFREQGALHLLWVPDQSKAPYLPGTWRAKGALMQETAWELRELLMR